MRYIITVKHFSEEVNTKMKNRGDADDTIVNVTNNVKMLSVEWSCEYTGIHDG